MIEELSIKDAADNFPQVEVLAGEALTYSTSSRSFLSEHGYGGCVPNGQRMMDLTAMYLSFLLSKFFGEERERMSE